MMKKYGLIGEKKQRKPSLVSNKRQIAFILNMKSDYAKEMDEFGNEYWEARELMPLLEYSKWENFHKVIKRAMIACETSNNNINDHFPEFRKMVDIGSKT